MPHKRGCMQGALCAAADALLCGVGMPGADQLPWLALGISLFRSCCSQPKLGDLLQLAIAKTLGCLACLGLCEACAFCLACLLSLSRSPRRGMRAVRRRSACLACLGRCEADHLCLAQSQRQAVRQGCPTSCLCLAQSQCQDCLAECQDAACRFLTTVTRTSDCSSPG